MRSVNSGAHGLDPGGHVTHSGDSDPEILAHLDRGSGSNHFVVHQDAKLAVAGLRELDDGPMDQIDRFGQGHAALCDLDDQRDFEGKDGVEFCSHSVHHARGGGSYG